MCTARGFCKLPSWEQQLQRGGIKGEKKKKGKGRMEGCCAALSLSRYR